MKTQLLPFLRLLLLGVSAGVFLPAPIRAEGANANSNRPGVAPALPPSPAPMPSAPVTPPSQVTIKRQVQPPASPSGMPSTDVLLSPTGRTSTSVTAGLETARLAPSLRAAPLATRDQVLQDLEARFSASENAVGALEKSSADMSPDARRQFKAAEEDVRERAKALRKSVQAARKAGDQDWDHARQQLASDYEAYSAALAKVGVFAGTSR